MLIADAISLGVGGAGRDGPGVVVGNVRGQPADRGGRTGVLVDARKQVGGWLLICGPAEPTGVSFKFFGQNLSRGTNRRTGDDAQLTSVKIHGHVGEIELSQRIICTFKVGTFSISTFGHIEVCHQVGETIGLCCRCNLAFRCSG